MDRNMDALISHLHALTLKNVHLMELLVGIVENRREDGKEPMVAVHASVIRQARKFQLDVTHNSATGCIELRVAKRKEE